MGACASRRPRDGVERDDRPGGLLMYGIPNMKLEKSVVERRVALMRELGIVFELGADVTNLR